ncbi:Odorant degrading enzyme CXE20 [Operophtera brumata]|uniref:Odorant degrading enzyme CXE20 n=1 Tax=Operophtera brumata TaxID=104452 RepID=A0A0L7LH21_OPEBR|nr:Odorant degrading enzyme CXE20 [Operophtera brumata]
MYVFQHPGDPPHWNGTLKADRRTILCKQFDPTTSSVVGIEDCLTLNIYTPAIITKPLPVIVFIFGGGLYKGSNTDDRYNAKYLVQKEVLVVTVNYRVGAFGFLCLKTKEAPGNVGIKDQVAALRWVKENIATFGGDPHSVTLHGESVGGSSVSLFILAQKAEGLFNRAIIDSGNAIRPMFFDRDPINTAAEVASRLGYNTTDPDELQKIFQNTTADEIVIASTNNFTNNAYGRFVFSTCIEDVNVSKNVILKEYPKGLLKSVKDIPEISIIMGYDNKDGIMWASDYNSEGLRDLDYDFTTVIPKSITFKTEENKSMFIEDVRELYFNNSKTNIEGLINYFSDALVHYPSFLVMKAFLTNPRISLYNYYFKYDSHRNKYKLASTLSSIPGASHCDELYYLFDPVEYRQTTPTPEDSRMIGTTFSSSE